MSILDAGLLISFFAIAHLALRDHAKTILTEVASLPPQERAHGGAAARHPLRAESIPTLPSSEHAHDAHVPCS